MTDRLMRELKLSRPLQPDEAVTLEVLKTADHVEAGLVALLKPHGLSPVQYNVLRILAGAGAAGLPCGDVAGRLVTRAPDITRLLDRMEKAGLICRERQSDDRRVVRARISPPALSLVERLAPLVREHTLALLKPLTRAERSTLVGLLERLRTDSSPTPPPTAP